MITVKQLQYRIGATNTAFRRVIQDTRNQVESVNGTFQRGALTIAKYGAAFTGMASGVLYAAKRLVDETSKSASAIQKMSIQSGVVAETLQAIGYAAEQNHASTEIFSMGMVRLGKRVAEAAAGNANYSKTFDELGISVKSAVDGSLRGSEDVFLDIADAFDKIADAGERDRIAFKLLGDSGRSLVPLLSQGRKEIERLADEAYDLGKVLSTDNIDQFARYDAMLTRFRATMQGVRNQAAGAILPVFVAVGEQIASNAYRITDWIAENRKFITQAVVVSGAVIGIGAALGLLIATITLGIKAFGIIAAAIGFIVSPVGLVLLTLGILYTAWTQNWLGMQDAVTEFWNNTKDIYGFILEFEKKVIETAWEWAVFGLDWISQEFIPWMKSLPSIILQRMRWIVQGIADLRDAAALAVNRSVQWTVNLARVVTDAVKGWIERTVEWGVNLYEGAEEFTQSWIERSVRWAVDLYKGAEEFAQEWIERSVRWSVNLYEGAEEFAQNWIARTVRWATNLYRGAEEFAEGWVLRVVRWAVNLYGGSEEFAQEWIGRTIRWSVNLYAGAEEFTLGWLNRGIRWAVNLYEGAEEFTQAWIGRIVRWAVNLYEGAEEFTQAWIGRSVRWAINLYEGAEEFTQTWIERTARWAVNLYEGADEFSGGWIGRTIRWAVNLYEGAEEFSSAWIGRTVRWAVNLYEGAEEFAFAWAERTVRWAVNLYEGTEEFVRGWAERSVRWAVTLYEGVEEFARSWIERSVEWGVDLAEGAEKFALTWVERTVRWGVNLYEGAEEFAIAWVERTIRWGVSLYEGAEEFARSWIERGVRWAVNLYAGAEEFALSWIERAVRWSVNLYEGTEEFARSWIERTVRWGVDLYEGAVRLTEKWTSGVVEWAVNLSRVVSDSKAGQILLGWMEGDRARGVELTAEGEVDLALEEKPPGWGTALENWLKERFDSLMWSEITEERFTELSDEFGEQAEKFVRELDGRFYESSPHKLELALDTVLHIGNFILGRMAWSMLTLAGGWMMKQLGATLTALAGIGAAWLIPVAVTGAVIISLVALFKMLPDKTKEKLETFLKLDLPSVLAAAGGAIGAVILGVTVGAGGVAIALAAILAFSVGLIDWDWAAAKAVDLWDSFMTWARGIYHDWLPGQPGFIRYPIQIIFQLLGLTFEDDIKDLPLAKQLEHALSKLEDEVQAYARLEERLAGGIAHPRERGEYEKAAQESRKRADAYAEEVNRLRALIDLENEHVAPISTGNERFDQLVGGPRLSESEILALGRGDALLDGLKPLTGTLDEVEVAGGKAAETIAKVVEAMTASGRHAHLREHVDVLTDMATRLVAIADAKGAPLTMGELADVMALMLSETSTLLGNAEEMQNPMRVTGDAMRDLAKDTEFVTDETDKLNRNLEAGLELFRKYVRSYGTAAHAAGAFMLPGFAARGEWDRKFDRPGTDIHGLSARDKMNAFDKIRNEFIFGGETTAEAWAEGLTLGESDVLAAILQLTGLVKGYVSGESPPPEGPLSDIDTGGKRVIEAWANGLLSAKERVREVSIELAQVVADYLMGRSPAKEGPLSEADTGAESIVEAMQSGMTSGLSSLTKMLGSAAKGIFEMLRNVFTTVFMGMRDLFVSTFPEIAEAFDDFLALIEEGMSEVERIMFGDDGSLEQGAKRASDAAIAWTESLVKGLSDAIAYGKSLGDVFDNLARQIASAVIENQLIGPLLMKFVPGVVDSLPIFHVGGMIEATTASVMHSGGNVGGLAYDERLIVGQVGERMLSRKQNDKFEQMLEEGMGGGGTDVTVIIQAVDAQSFVSMSRRNPEAITSVILDNIRGNGVIRKAIQGIRG